MKRYDSYELFTAYFGNYYTHEKADAQSAKPSPASRSARHTKKHNKIKKELPHE